MQKVIKNSFSSYSADTISPEKWFFRNEEN